jgi:putative thioredoxin
LSNPSLPKNFARAVDLSTLGKPAVAAPQVGVVLTEENLVNELLPLTHQIVAVVICWSPRSPESVKLVELLGALQKDDLMPDGRPRWILGTVNVDAEAGLATALQVKAVPFALAIIQEQMVPLFETIPTPDQVKLVIQKVLTLAAERGVGEPPATAEVSPEAAPEPEEPEELEAIAAIEAGNFLAAIAAYKKWIARVPNEQMAKLGLAQAELLQRIDGLDLAGAIAHADADAGNTTAQMLAADAAIALGDYQGAFDRLIAAVKKSSGDEKKAVREHLLGLFNLIDVNDPELGPVIIKARQRLASALY